MKALGPRHVPMIRQAGIWQVTIKVACQWVAFQIWLALKRSWEAAALRAARSSLQKAARSSPQKAARSGPEKAVLPMAALGMPAGHLLTP